MTVKQQAAIDKLRNTPLDSFPRTQLGSYKTGINSHILRSLYGLGLIKCSVIYQKGIITKDLEIVQK